MRGGDEAGIYFNDNRCRIEAEPNSLHVSLEGIKLHGGSIEPGEGLRFELNPCGLDVLGAYLEEVLHALPIIEMGLSHPTCACIE